jgi:hypothetical protein
LGSTAHVSSSNAAAVPNAMLSAPQDGHYHGAARSDDLDDGNS